MIVVKQRVKSRVLVHASPEEKNIINKAEFDLYKDSLQQIKYGLANLELKHLADAYDKVRMMRKIIDQTT